MKINDIKHIALAAMVMAGVSAVDMSAREATQLSVSDINIDIHDNNVTLSLDINPRDVNPGRDRELILTPVIVSDAGTDSVVMPAIRISGRNRYYSHIRNKDLAEGERIFAANSSDIIEYRRQIPFEIWMEHSHVDMRARTAHCCDPIKPDVDTPLAQIDLTPVRIEPKFNFVALTGDESIERSAEGSAFIDFIVNRTEIKPTYRRNTVELAKIIESIDFVKNDPDAVITRVTIKGFASPEGPYSNNVRLAMGRTEALKEYVRSHYHFDPSIMNSDYEPEDWEGLRRRLLELDIPNREAILAIIDSPMEPDPKNAEIQSRYPAQYKFLLDSIYPALRHSDYTVNYKIRTYVDIEELKRVYASNPSNLRPVDFERIAGTMQQWSPEWEEVYMTAVREHPGDLQANLNAANIQMRRGNIDEARQLLNRAGDSPEATYARATLAALDGDLARAAALYDDAASMGLEGAAAERDRVTAELSRPRVTYLIEPKR